MFDIQALYIFPTGQQSFQKNSEPKALDSRLRRNNGMDIFYFNSLYVQTMSHSLKFRYVSPNKSASPSQRKRE